ncbi:hypothetical protein ADL26_19185, partial [Thermoactinomyces vulgaris]
MGDLVKGRVSIADGPAPAVPGVYETVAPSTVPVDALARLVTDGLRFGDGTTPGSVPAAGAGQPSFTALTVQASNEVAASLHGANDGRPAAAAECPAELVRGTDRSKVEDVR